MGKATMGAVAFLVSGALIFGLVQRGAPTGEGAEAPAVGEAARQADADAGESPTEHAPRSEATAMPTGKAAAPAPGQAFADLDFDAAVEQAREQDRWLLVKFGADWCAPCRRMDATTMKDPEVLGWIGDHAVAVAVDVDERPDLAMRYRATAIPLTVLIRDGEERDRVVGYRSTEQLLDWFELVEQGGTASAAEQTELDRRLASLEAPAGPGGQAMPVMERADLARQLQQAGRFEEALEQRLWLWKHAVAQEPGFTGVRRSFWVSDMRQLAEAHEPARIVFDGMRVQLERAVFEGDAGFDELRDWLALCQVVGAEDRLLVWYESVRDEDGHLPARQKSAEHNLFKLLIDRGRHAEAGRLYRDADRRIQSAVSLYGRGSLRHVPEGSEAMMKQTHERLLRSQLARLHACFLAAGRDDDAHRAATELLRALDDVTSRSALVETAADFGVADEDHVMWLIQAEAMSAEDDTPSLIDRLLPRGARGPSLADLRRRLGESGLEVPVPASTR